MAGTSLLTLLDDIATGLDTVAGLTKIATKKTAGVLGDDLALNAEQVVGVVPDRELRVIFRVLRGSSVNKAILVPVALLISAFLPWAITPLLMLGGAFLCFEGFEKLVHPKKVAPKPEEVVHAGPAILSSDLLNIENEKIKTAVRTDFILSAEIIVIALGTLKGQPLSVQLATLVTVALIMTVGVYGLVALIVKMDDAGLALRKSPNGGFRALGDGLLVFAPRLLKFLSLAGTAAMFLVGGGIVAHGIPPLVRFESSFSGSSLAWLYGSVMNGITGLVLGAALVGVVLGIQKARAAR